MSTFMGNQPINSEVSLEARIFDDLGNCFFEQGIQIFLSENLC